jgi:MFS family permease
MTYADVAVDARTQPRIPFWTILLLAFACGLVAANIYYAQPLAGPIGAALGIPPGATGLIVTLTQVGYGAGLLLVVPLGDLLETRRLVMALLGLASLALLCRRTRRNSSRRPFASA